MRKGQEFASLKLVLGAVFAAILLVIVYSSVQMLRPPVTGSYLSEKVLVEAMNLPGRCLSQDGVIFKEGESFLTTSFIQGVDVKVESSFSFIECDYPDCFILRDATVTVSAICALTKDSCTLYLGFQDCNQ